MKKHNPIDELFHRRLSGHESPVPVDMFESIQSARQKSSTPVILPAWWMAAAASVLLLVVAFFWGYQQGRQDQASLSHFPIAMEDQTPVSTLTGQKEKTAEQPENTLAEGRRKYQGK